MDLLYPDENKDEKISPELSILIKDTKPTDNPILILFELK
jgi:hypothetical protein